MTTLQPDKHPEAAVRALYQLHDREGEAPSWGVWQKRTAELGNMTAGEAESACNSVQPFMYPNAAIDLHEHQGRLRRRPARDVVRDVMQEFYGRKPASEIDDLMRLKL